jgi:hypothetical protein
MLLLCVIYQYLNNTFVTMNTKILKNIAFLLLVFSTFRLSASDTLSLADAIAKKQVSVAITGVDPIRGFEAVHFGECIKLKVINLTDKEFVIRIETGRILKSKDATISNMLISKNKWILLAAKKEVNLKLTAICAEYTKTTPTAASIYTVGDMCDNLLKKVASEIEAINCQNEIGQYAIWCVTDNLPLSGLTDLCKDKVKSAPLIRAVCRAQHISSPNAYANATVSQRINFN